MTEGALGSDLLWSNGLRTTGTETDFTAGLLYCVGDAPWNTNSVQNEG